jgi:hypothetical protein
MGLNTAIIIMAFVVLAIVGMVAWVQLRMSAGLKRMGEHLAATNLRIATLEGTAAGKTIVEEILCERPSIGGPETAKQRKKNRTGHFGGNAAA